MVSSECETLIPLFLTNNEKFRPPIYDGGWPRITRKDVSGIFLTELEIIFTKPVTSWILSKKERSGSEPLAKICYSIFWKCILLPNRWMLHITRFPIIWVQPLYRCFRYSKLIDEFEFEIQCMSRTLHAKTIK